jgi:hypothetical protein
MNKYSKRFKPYFLGADKKDLYFGFQCDTVGEDADKILATLDYFLNSSGTYRIISAFVLKPDGTLSDIVRASLSVQMSYKV